MASIFEIFISITLYDERNSDLQKFRSGREGFSRYRNLKVTFIPPEPRGDDAPGDSGVEFVALRAPALLMVSGERGFQMCSVKNKVGFACFVQRWKIGVKVSYESLWPCEFCSTSVKSGSVDETQF
jgi:hypothetical protein